MRRSARRDSRGVRRIEWGLRRQAGRARRRRVRRVEWKWGGLSGGWDGQEDGPAGR